MSLTSWVVAVCLHSDLSILVCLRDLVLLSKRMMAIQNYITMISKVSLAEIGF